MLHSFSQSWLWAYLLGDAIKRSFTVNVTQTAILKWALQFLRTPRPQSHSHCPCNKNIHWEGHFLFWTLCSSSDRLIDLYLALDSQVLISYHKTEKISSSRWSNWPDPQRWLMSEANSGRELSPGLLLPTNLILKSNLPLFLEHPDFNPFPAFQDLHGTRLCQLAKSGLDQQDSAWSEKLRGSVVEENTTDQFRSNFRRTERLWFPADSPEGRLLILYNSKRRVKGTLGTIWRYRMECDSPQG